MGRRIGTGRLYFVLQWNWPFSNDSWTRIESAPMSKLSAFKKLGLLYCRRIVRLSLMLLFIPAGLIWISGNYGPFLITIMSTHATPPKTESGKGLFGLRMRGCTLAWGMGHIVLICDQAYTDYISNKIPSSLSRFRIDWSKTDLSDPIDLLPSGNWHGFQLAVERTGPMKDGDGNVEQWSKSADLAFPAWLLFSISLIGPILYLFRRLRRIPRLGNGRGFAAVLQERPGETKSDAPNVSRADR